MTCINGPEISPGYTEQNDPIAQRWNRRTGVAPVSILN
jgi:lysyl-tRNA synthetase class II